MADPTADNYEETYDHILTFYDFAEALIQTVDDEAVTDPESQLFFIEPLVQQIENATDTLAEEYRNFIRTGKKPGNVACRRIETALANVHFVLKTCNDLAEKKEGSK